MTPTGGKTSIGWRPFADRAEAWEVALDNAGLVYDTLEGLRGQLPQSVEAEQLLSWAWEALHRAVIGFRPELGYRFSTYAVLSVRRAIFRGIRVELRGLTDFDGARRAWPSANPTAVVAPSREGDGDDPGREVIHVEDFSPDVDTRVDDQVRLRVVLEAADPDDIALLRAYYMDGRSLSELGREAGVTGEAMRLRRDRALARVREAVAHTTAGGLVSPAGPGPDGGDAAPSSAAASGAGATHSIKKTDRKETP